MKSNKKVVIFIIIISLVCALFLVCILHENKEVDYYSLEKDTVHVVDVKQFFAGGPLYFYTENEERYMIPPRELKGHRDIIPLILEEDTITFALEDRAWSVLIPDKRICDIRSSSRVYLNIETINSYRESNRLGGVFGITIIYVLFMIPSILLLVLDVYVNKGIIKRNVKSAKKIRQQRFLDDLDSFEDAKNKKKK